MSVKILGMVYFVTQSVNQENTVTIVLKLASAAIIVLVNKIVESVSVLLAGQASHVSLLVAQELLVPYALKHVKTRVQVKICLVIM